MRSKFKWIFTLLVALTMQFSFAQEKTVTGVVSDDLGPIAGANVVVKGTTRGTTTDFDGNYAISAKEGEVLEISYVGYANQEVTVGGANSYDVMIKPAQLEEVVVTALGIKRKEDAITSNYQVVKTEELTAASNPNAVQSLTGKVSGLTINTTGNGANASMSIRLRGNRSMTGNNEAMIVIDGAISSASIFAALPPTMVESVTILKGAQGAALYGKDGSNGVIMVTTKKGTEGEKFKVTINSSYDVQQVAYLPERQTRYGAGWDGTYYSYENGGWGPEMDGSMVPVGFPDADGNYIMTPYSSKGSDNIKEFFRNGVITQNGVQLSAGNKDSYLNFSANNQTTEFVIDGDELKRKTFFLNAGKTAGKFSVDANVSYITSKTDQVASTSSGSHVVMYNLLQTPTNVPIEQFDNGSGNGWSKYIMNPYWQVDNIRNVSRSDVFNGIAKIGYKFNDNISVQYNNSLRFIQNNFLHKQRAFEDPFAYIYDMSEPSTFSSSNSNSRTIYSDLLLNFDYNLTDDLTFGLILGNNIQDSYYQSTGVGGENLTIPGLYNISNATSNLNVNSNTFNSYTRTRSYAFFGNLDLGYKDFLFLNATLRNDTVSFLKKGNNSYWYPSAGLSFVPTKAFEGLRNNNVLNYAKISVNWTRVGQTGRIGAYDINNAYGQATGYPFGGLSSFVQPTTIYDSNITPEFYTTKELTVNLGFFKDRLTLDGSFYITNTKDLITGVGSSYASSATQAFVNIGEMENKGFEIDLGFTPIKTENFRWDNKLSYTTYSTKVKKVSDQSDSLPLSYSATSMGGYGIYAEVGEEFPIIKGYGFQRDDNGNVIVDAATGNPLRTNDFIKLGKVNPDFIINYSTNLNYKGWKLGAVLDYRGGHQFLSQSKWTVATFGYLVESAEGGRDGGFIYPNSVISDGSGGYVQNTSVLTGGSSYASLQQYYANQYTETAENFVVDADALRVRELSLSYSLPSKLLNRSGVEALTIGVNLRNPFTWLPKQNRGYADPESAFSTGNANGFAYVGSYPQTRTYGCTLNVTF